MSRAPSPLVWSGLVWSGGRDVRKPARGVSDRLRFFKGSFRVFRAVEEWATSGVHGPRVRTPAPCPTGDDTSTDPCPPRRRIRRSRRSGDDRIPQMELRAIARGFSHRRRHQYHPELRAVVDGESLRRIRLRIVDAAHGGRRRVGDFMGKMTEYKHLKCNNGCKSANLEEFTSHECVIASFLRRLWKKWPNDRVPRSRLPV